MRAVWRKGRTEAVRQKTAEALPVMTYKVNGFFSKSKRRDWRNGLKNRRTQLHPVQDTCFRLKCWEGKVGKTVPSKW